MPVTRDKDTGQWAPNGGRVRPPSRTDWRTATVHADSDEDDDRAPAPAVTSDGTARGDALAAKVADRQRAANAKAEAKVARRAGRMPRNAGSDPEPPGPGRLSRLMGRGRAKAAEEAPARLEQAGQRFGRGVDEAAMTVIGGAARKVAKTVDEAEVT